MATFTARRSGKPNLSSLFLKKASTAIAQGAVLTVEAATGHVTNGTAATTNVKGISMETIASTDSDYATARPILVDIPLPGDLFEMACNTTITQAMVGDFFDLADSQVVDNSDLLGAVDVVELVGIVQPTYTSATSPSVGLFRFNPTVVLATPVA